MYKGKKILVLAGVGPHSKVVEAASEMGIYTIVTDYLENSPAKKIADEALMYNIGETEQLIKYCKENKVDGVICFCVDPAQKPAQEIAEQCGLPVFGTKKQVYSMTNKKAFKSACIEAGVDIIPEYTQEDIKTGKLSYPVLVKPVDSRGSRGCIVCENYDELIVALPLARAESTDNDVIIERYMSNHQDLTISYIVKNGIPTLVSVGDRYPGKSEDDLNRQLICTIQPSRYIEMYLNKVDTRVKRLIKYLGIENGPVFMQGFVDGDTVRMYDPGIRFPGNEYERILKKATNIDLMEYLVAYCVGGAINAQNDKIDNCYELDGKCAIQYMINLGEGEIARFEGLEEILKHEKVVDVQQRHFVGSKITKTGDIRHRAGEISILVNRDISEMMEIVKFIQSKLIIEDTKGKSMIISPINVEAIKDIYTNAGYMK